MLSKPRETVIGELMGKINESWEIEPREKRQTEWGGSSGAMTQFDFSKMDEVAVEVLDKETRMDRGDSLKNHELFEVPTNLDSVEKSALVPENKEINITSSFTAYFRSPQMRDSDAGTVVLTEKEVAKENKSSFINMIEKFGFVEMKEIHNIFQESKEAEETQMTLAEVYVESLTDKEMYLEDIQQVPLFVNEIPSSINSLLQGAYNSTICAFAVSRQGTLAVFGTETGELIEIMIREKSIVKKHTMESKVTAVAVSPNEEYFVAGTLNSELTFQRSNSKLARKLIKNLNQQKISQITFADNATVLVATMYNVYYFSISGVSILMDVTMIPVMPRQPYLVLQLSSMYLDSVLRVIVTFVDRISLYCVKKGDKVSEAFKVGCDIEDDDCIKSHQNNKWPPVVDWMSPDGESMSPLFVVFWKNKVTLVNFGEDEWDGIQTRKLQTLIVWGKVFDSRLLCILNKDLDFEFLSVNKIFAKGWKHDGTNSRMQIDHAIMKDDRDKMYMTKYKDKLEDETIDINLKLPFFQFFRNRLKETKSEIFMVTLNGLLKYRLVTLDKVIDFHVARGDYLAGMKMINNMFLNRIYSKPSEKDATRPEVPKVVFGYVSKKLKSNMMTDDIRYLLDVGIETLLYSGNELAIFDEIKTKFSPKLFWEEISKFIKNKKLKFVPYEALAEESGYLDNGDIIDILRNFRIEEESEDEETINKVLKIIKKKNIWPYLYKFCIFQPVQSIPIFLSMLAAEILSRKAKLPVAKRAEPWLDPATVDLDRVFEDDQTILLFRVFWFFNLVLAEGSLEKSMSDFSKNPEKLVQNIPEIYCKTIEWLLDLGNMNTIIEICPAMFFELIFECMMNIDLLKTKKVIDVVRKIKNRPQNEDKKAQESVDTNTPQYVADFRANQNLKIDPYPFAVVENLLMILKELFDPKYNQQFGFLVMKILINGKHDQKFDNQEWIWCALLEVMKEPYRENAIWDKYETVSADDFEDTIIDVYNKIELVKHMKPLKKELEEMAFKNK